MRTALRIAATLLLTIAVVWIGFYVWLFLSSAGESQLLLLPANLVLNAWPAFVLILIAGVVGWLYWRSSRNGDAS